MDDFYAAGSGPFPPPPWTSFAPPFSERLTGALLDRLIHHLRILEMNGDSFRLRQSRINKT